MPKVNRLYIDPDKLSYDNNVCLISDKIAVMSVGKCACSSLTMLHLENLNLNLPNDFYKSDLFWPTLWQNQVKLCQLDKSVKVYAVLRDPGDRLLSAWQTVDPSSDWSTFLKIFKKSIHKLSVNEIDVHLRPQSWFYDYNPIEEFIWIQDLSDWLSSHGFRDKKLNASTHKSLNIPFWAKKYYKRDYDMIRKVKDKIWLNH